ncbi:hypothetical protein Cgig2_024713 [Carnegiea gigantea]|uniref:Uncharacterized protein n=1 Tax=Carnegiea gigantea TaxID=171969 RepID=A0A9Q1JSR1_9CARY|nr:hypothetical protein Cgig2_024713 [Carnegiea gigantea]
MKGGHRFCTRREPAHSAQNKEARRSTARSRKQSSSDNPQNQQSNGANTKPYMPIRSKHLFHTQRNKLSARKRIPCHPGFYAEERAFDRSSYLVFIHDKFGNRECQLAVFGCWTRIIFLCWISTMTCWLLTGIDFSLHNFAEDTCTALEDFKENPQNSSLSSMLPCVDALKSQGVMVQIGQTVHTFITELNSNINVIPKELGINVARYNHVLGNERKICDPFSGPPDFTYLQGECPKNAIHIRDLPDILARFTCNDNKISMEPCKGYGKFLPETTYLMANAYIRSVQNLIDVYPYLEDLIHCSFVKDRVSDVVLHQCKPFRKCTYGLWVSTLCLSLCMTVLVLVWVAEVYLNWGRSFPWCSVLPIVTHENQQQGDPPSPPLAPPAQQDTSV